MTHIEFGHKNWTKDAPPPDVVVIPLPKLLDVWNDGFVSGFTTALVNNGHPLDEANLTAQALVRRMEDSDVMRAQVIEAIRQRLQGEELTVARASWDAPQGEGGGDDD